MTAPPPRGAGERKRDVLRRLEHDIDAWAATADTESGTPYLVPLSFLWDGTAAVVATPATSPTGRNLRATGRVRLGVGHTRDVVLIEGMIDQILTTSAIAAEVGDSFAVKTGFDPRLLTSSYEYFHIVPQRIQAWRESNELEGRDLMRDGVWLV